MDQTALLPPHVLIFPIPMQGPVNSMFKIAELLCLAGFHITFLVTDHIYNRLKRYAGVSRLKHYPGFHLEPISDGLSDDHPRSGTREGTIELLDSMKVTTKSLLREMLRSSGLLNSEKRRPVTCIIADGMLGFACDVAEEIGVPMIYARTVSPCSLWIFFCLPQLIEAKEVPFQENDDLDTPIQSVPGMQHFLRRRDLPIFCRSGDLNNPRIQLFKTERQENSRAYGLILNTFEELEGPLLSQIQSVCPNLYPIGPLHSHLNTKLAFSTIPNSISNSLWEEDRSCMDWLDAQPLKSVIYVSFGSLTNMTKDQLMEFWHGLVNSEKRFLWAIRPGFVVGENWEREIPVEISEGTKERGYIVGWAPQEEVLAHRAVGGFLTHSGWNSTLESIVAGVPMICWPYIADQHMNSRFVGEVWKLGLDMKDSCDRVIVEKMVKDLMEVRMEEFLEKANQMEKLAKESVNEGGSSYCNFKRLVEDIKLMSVISP